MQIMISKSRLNEIDLMDFRHPRRKFPAELTTPTYPNIENTLEWNRISDNEGKIYASIIGPIYDTQRLIGCAPFYRDHDGKLILAEFI